MPRTQIPVTSVTRIGVAPPAQLTGDDANGMYFLNNSGGTIWVEIENTDASDKNVGFALRTSVIDGVSVPDKFVVVPAGTVRLAGPWPPALYNQVDSWVWIDPDAATNLLFRAYSL